MPEDDRLTRPAPPTGETGGGYGWASLVGPDDGNLIGGRLMQDYLTDAVEVESLARRLERLSQAYQDAAGRVEAAELFLRGLRLDRKKAAGEYDAAAALFYSETPRTNVG